VIVGEKRAPGLLRRVTGEPPVEALRGKIGDETMLVLANRAALGPGAAAPR
jgi:hypothetical protein